MTNSTQILEEYWRDHPAWFGRSYGEYLHLGANEEMLRLVLAGVPIDATTRGLDLSCALGGNARWLASLYGCRVEGVDAFKPAVQCARKLAKAQGLAELVTFQTGSIDALPYSAASFDLVLTTDDDVVWPEVSRVLAKNGRVIGSSIVSGGLASLDGTLRAFGFEIEQMIDVTPYARAFYRGKEEEAKLLVAAGLMRPDDMLSLQMHTVDLYDAGNASHALFRLRRSA